MNNNEQYFHVMCVLRFFFFLLPDKKISAPKVESYGADLAGVFATLVPFFFLSHLLTQDFFCGIHAIL